MEAQAREFHKLLALLAGRESLNPDNTIERVVMLAKSSRPHFLSRDNGDARPTGQRPSGLFQSLLQRLAGNASLRIERSAILESCAKHRSFCRAAAGLVAQISFSAAI